MVPRDYNFLTFFKFHELIIGSLGPENIFKLQLWLIVEYKFSPEYFCVNKVRKKQIFIYTAFRNSLKDSYKTTDLIWYHNKCSYILYYTKGRYHNLKLYVQFRMTSGTLYKLNGGVPLSEFDLWNH